MDRTRANLWGSGPKGTVSVTAFSGGVSVGGVYQLIGNVWEWMRGSYPPPDATEAGWIFETPLKSIRGGAFDTYFDTQATCQFQSGETAIARKHNIGFRCAVGVCDLLLARSAEDDAAAAPIQVDLPEEVPA
jgi:iron(II)-dependent oxidoreductase